MFSRLLQANVVVAPKKLRLLNLVWNSFSEDSVTGSGQVTGSPGQRPASLLASQEIFYFRPGSVPALCRSESTREKLI